MDLTPYYLDEEDVKHFHGKCRDVCGTSTKQEKAWKNSANTRSIASTKNSATVIFIFQRGSSIAASVDYFSMTSQQGGRRRRRLCRAV